MDKHCFMMHGSQIVKSYSNPSKLRKVVVRIL